MSIAVDRARLGFSAGGMKNPHPVPPLKGEGATTVGFELGERPYPAFGFEERMA